MSACRFDSIGKCCAIRAGVRQKTCCNGCRYLGKAGCDHPNGKPLSCRLWLCPYALAGLSKDIELSVKDEVSKAHQAGELMFRENPSTNRDGERVLVPVEYCGITFLIPALKEDADDEGAK